MSYFQAFIAFALGAALWTLTEYVLHRFLGHVKTKHLVRTRFHKEHSKHHFKRNYFAGAWDKGLTLAATVPLILLLSGNVAFTLGFALMYLSYEVIHKRMHVKAPPHAYASFMRAHHFYHHFSDESMNHGVTTPIWDLVFGTYRTSSTISFPKRFGLSWIVTDSHGIYRDRWGRTYQQTE